MFIKIYNTGMCKCNIFHIISSLSTKIGRMWFMRIKLSVCPSCITSINIFLNILLSEQLRLLFCFTVKDASFGVRRPSEIYKVSVDYLCGRTDFYIIFLFVDIWLTYCGSYVIIKEKTFLPVGARWLYLFSKAGRQKSIYFPL